jgi:hypothetical protein
MEELLSQEKPDIEIEAGFCGDFNATVTATGIVSDAQIRSQGLSQLDLPDDCEFSPKLPGDPSSDDEAGFCVDFDATVTATGKKEEDNEDDRRAKKRIRALEAENEELAKKIRVIINSNWINNKPGEILSPDEAMAEYFDAVSTSTPSSPMESPTFWSLYVYTYEANAYIGISSEADPFSRIRRHFSKVEVKKHGRKNEHFRQMKEKKSDAYIESRFSVLVYKSLTKKLVKEVESGAELKSRKRIF